MGVTMPNPSWLNGFSDSVKNLSGGGTANGLTPNQNLNNVLQQKGNTQVSNPVNMPIINQANADTAAATPNYGPTIPKDMNTGADVVKPTVNSFDGSNNNITSNWSTTPGQAMQSATEQAKARIDQLLAGGKNAYNTGITSANNAKQYTDQITGDSRNLRNAEFKNHNDPFSGNTQYLASNMLRNDSIQDTASNADYQNKVNQISQTWQDLQTAAPEQQQVIQDQLYQQAAALGMQADQLNLQAAGQQAQYGGTYNGAPTLQAQQNTIDNNRNAALDTYNQNQDTIKNDQSDRTYTLDAQKQMADLTGYISDGKGGYVPTTAQQKQDLTDAWTATTNMGSVTPALSKLTGIPVGTPTQTAKNQAQQIAVSNRNATNSENSTANTKSNNDADNARADNAVNLTASQNDYTSKVYAELTQLDPSDAAAYLKQNSADIVHNLGQKGYDSLMNSATSGQAANNKAATDASNASLNLREKAIAAAQKVYNFDNMTLDQQKALIKQYEELYK